MMIGERFEINVRAWRVAVMVAEVDAVPSSLAVMVFMQSTRSEQQVPLSLACVCVCVCVLFGAAKKAAADAARG